MCTRPKSTSNLFCKHPTFVSRCIGRKKKKKKRGSLVRRPGSLLSLQEWIGGYFWFSKEIQNIWSIVALYADIAQWLRFQVWALKDWELLRSNKKLGKLLQDFKALWQRAHFHSLSFIYSCIYLFILNLKSFQWSLLWIQLWMWIKYSSSGKHSCWFLASCRILLKAN